MWSSVFKNSLLVFTPHKKSEPADPVLLESISLSMGVNLTNISWHGNPLAIREIHVL